MMKEKNFISYFAVFSINEDQKYFVDFPDLQGCYTQGDSLEEAICNAHEVLAIYYQERLVELPPASDFSSICKKYTDSIIQLIVLDTNKCIVKSLRTVKKTLTIPEWLNGLSEKYKVNFSQILKNALICYLKNLNSITEQDKRMLEE